MYNERRDMQSNVTNSHTKELHRAQLHTLQHNASVNQRLGRSTSVTAHNQVRRRSAVLERKPELITNGQSSRISTTPSRRLSHPTEAQEERNVAANTLLSLQASPPFSRLGSGQSDPFDALAIKVTPEINEIISFGRDVFLPALHDAAGAKQAFIVNWSFQDSVKRLGSEGSAYGLLSYYATAASCVAGGDVWARKAMKYEIACTTFLRKRIHEAPISEYPGLITKILSLFGCTILTGRMAEAKTHAAILRKLFDVCSKHGSVDIVRLCFALYYDRNLSAMFLVRSSFDVDGWVSAVVAPVWKMLGTPFPHLFEVPQQRLDRSIARGGPAFTRLIADIRNHYHTVVLTRERWSQEETPSNLVMYHVSHSVIYETRLINAYLDLTEEQLVPPQDLWPQAYICLATLYMAHSLLYSPVIRGVRLNDTTANLREHLQNAIVNAERTATIESRHRYNNALLWALFIGSTAERLRSGSNSSGSTWFNIRFREHLLSMGLTKWNDVRKAIIGLPCAAELLEQEVTWLEQYMRLSYYTDGTVRTASSAFRMYNSETGRFD